jgi:hypothetical protein
VPEKHTRFKKKDTSIHRPVHMVPVKTINLRLLFIPVSLALLFIFVSPAAATVVLSTVSFVPDPPLSPGGQQRVVATYAIIPSGSATFAPGHSLQMQTDLTGAQWTLQVTLDRSDAARQTVSGSTAFVNGSSSPTEQTVTLVSS